MRAPLALTMGDPAGIGGEITLATWLRRKQADVPPFFTVDDPKRLDELARRLNLEVPITVIGKAQESLAAFRDALPVLPLALPCAPEPGKPNSGNAAATLASIEAAYESVMRGEAAAMVTNPIAKSVLYEAGFKHPGHTEFLATLAGVQRPVMMLASELLRVVPVTIHVSLRDAIAALTTKDIVDTAVITANGLQQDFGLSHPRLAVAGLNPHAGESGAMGDEDDRIVRPAVEALKAMGIEARGPLPPDTMFHAGARATYDAAICMYHDQALIPIKTLDFDRGVNVTLGLPIIRTSPDHGTAFDIAGRGIASPESLIAALHMAAAMAHHRALHRVQLGAQV